MILDDHALFRESVARLLSVEPDFEVVGHFGTVNEALELVTTQPVDLVMLDLDLGSERGSDFLTRARARGFAGHVLIVAAGVSDPEAADLIRDGAVGIFLKQSSPEHLPKSIRKIMAGELWLDQKYLKALLQHPAQPAPGRQEQFTERQKDILRAVLEGLANKEIAVKLGISEASVKASLQQVFNKTGVRTRSQLVRFALEQFSEKE